MKIQWYINPEGSNFTFDQLFPVLTWCLKMVALVSTHEFNTVIKTNARPGEQPRGAKLLSFARKEHFHMATANNGAEFNTRHSPSLFILGAVLLHEITHGWSGHDEVNTDTIMSTVRLFGNRNRALLYPKDIIAINTVIKPWPVEPDIITTPKNVCVADEMMMLMVPAVAMPNGLQHWVLLEHVSGRLLKVRKTSAFGEYLPATVAFENPCSFENNILTLGDVHTPGGIVPNVELKYLDDEKLLEWVA